jgi:hypothetical protein
MIAMMSVAAPAVAQTTDQSGDQSDPQRSKVPLLKRTEQARVPTRITSVTEPLSKLLDEGWAISSGVPAALILSKGNKWISCSYDTGLMSGQPSTSECWALN